MNSAFPTRLGLFGIGLDTYWPQFKGLKNRLVGYQKQIAERLVGGGAPARRRGFLARRPPPGRRARPPPPPGYSLG